MQVIEITDAELQLIKQIGDENQNQVDWSDNRLTPIRLRIKHHYLGEQKHHCCYCQQQIYVTHGRAWDLEHVLTRTQHPEFVFEPKNLIVACIDCNGAKGEKSVLAPGVATPPYPNSSAAFLIIHPHFDNYSDHIDLLNGYGFVPRTLKGTATISVCELHRFYSKFDLDVVPDDDLLVSIVDRIAAAENPDQKRIALLEIGVLVDRARKNIK